jgi:hypothetical protein
MFPCAPSEPPSASHTMHSNQGMLTDLIARPVVCLCANPPASDCSCYTGPLLLRDLCNDLPFYQSPPRVRLHRELFGIYARKLCRECGRASEIITCTKTKKCLAARRGTAQSGGEARDALIKHERRVSQKRRSLWLSSPRRHRARYWRVVTLATILCHRTATARAILTPLFTPPLFRPPWLSPRG